MKMNFIDDIKALLKNFTILSFLIFVLAIIAILSIGVLIVGVTIYFLYIHHYHTTTIIMSAVGSWFGFLLIMALIVYFYLKVCKRKKRDFINLMNKQLFATIGLQTINSIFRKLRKKKVKAHNET
jgi:uncharacterized membrane protein YbhN (UPF0104 family)